MQQRYRTGGDVWGFRLDLAAKESLARVVRRGAGIYDRARDLPRLLPIGPDEIADERIEARRAVLARLARALRAERNRGRAGHWTYDLNRHIGLKQAYEAERRLVGARVLPRAPKSKTAAGLRRRSDRS